MKLIICQGLPASGKSTWTLTQLNENTIEVNRDNILKEWNQIWTPDINHLIKIERNDRIIKALKLGLNVISSDCNFGRNYTTLEKIGMKYKAEIELKKFETPLDECIRRDSLRINPVGKDEIIRLATIYKLISNDEYNDE